MPKAPFASCDPQRHQSLSPDTARCAGKAEESIVAEVTGLVRKPALLQLLSSTAPTIRKAAYSCISTVCKR